MNNSVTRPNLTQMPVWNAAPCLRPLPVASSAQNDLDALGFRGQSMCLSLKAQVPSLLLPQGTRAGQCQTPSIHLAARLCRETYLSCGEGHHSWAVGMEGREREIRNKDAVSIHQQIQSTFTPEIETNK